MSQNGIFTQLWPLIKYVYQSKTYFFLLHYQTWVCWLSIHGKIICRFKTFHFGYFQTRLANSGQCVPTEMTAPIKKLKTFFLKGAMRK